MKTGDYIVELKQKVRDLIKLREELDRDNEILRARVLELELQLHESTLPRATIKLQHVGYTWKDLSDLGKVVDCIDFTAPGCIPTDALIPVYAVPTSKDNNAVSS